MQQEEFATLGGAIIGGRMVGFWDDPVEVATRFTKPGDRINPIRGNSIHYQKLSDLYEELLSGMKELFEKVSQG